MFRYSAWSAYAIDLANDDDNDILSASSSDNKIAWYENLDGLGTFSDQKIITTDAAFACFVFAADLDNDGDNDVLSASKTDNKIAWYENIDGKGTFNDQNIITTDAEGAASVYATDLDNDGDQDVISASEFDNKIAWYENIDGAGTFSSQRVITTEARGAKSVFAIDIDGDGDQDVLSASPGDDKLAWYKNLLINTSIGDVEQKILLQKYTIGQNFPNPFNMFTNIQFSLPDPTYVRIILFDLRGKKIETILDNYYSQGSHNIIFNGSSLSSGFYFYKIEAGSYSESKKMILLK